MKKQLNIHKSVFVADGAKITGKIIIGKNSSIWYNCVIRSDYDNTEVIIGENTTIQDRTVIHLGMSESTIIGNNVTIEHNCVIHGCTIEDSAFIEMGSVILNGAKIGKNSIIKAGSVVKQNCIVEPNSVYAGSPAKKVYLNN